MPRKSKKLKEEIKFEKAIEPVAEPVVESTVAEPEPIVPKWPVEVLGGRKYYRVRIEHLNGDVTTELRPVD